MASVFHWLYDAVMLWSDRGVMASWRRRVVSPSAGLMIEIGAGSGLGFRHYDAAAIVVAVEPDAVLRGRAARRAAASPARVLLVAADARCLPFPPAIFDGAVVQLALCTIPDPQEALGELRRVLRASGRLRALEHVRMVSPRLARLQDWMTPVWRRFAGGCHLNRDTRRLIANAGFAIDEIRGHAGGLFLELTGRVPTERRG